MRKAADAFGVAAEWDRALEQAKGGARLSADWGARLFSRYDLYALGDAAAAVCRQRVPGSERRTTFVIDRNINYTNICVSRCRFCSFYRAPGDAGGYLRTPEEIFERIDELVSRGGTQVMLQGGLHPGLSVDYFTSLFSAIRLKYPRLVIHALSAPEIDHIAKISKLTIEETLRRLQGAGLESLPGGGAEILSQPVRNRLSPEKIGVKAYLEVHRKAHELGMKSTATMVYGLGEGVRERMEHLERLRELQDRTGGFRAFIPWSFEPEGTGMSREKATGEEYLRMVAVSRLMLDNIPHLQAGWLTEGPKLAQLALFFGADDFGGILMEENVVAGKAGVCARMCPEEVRRLIRQTGREPVERNTRYEWV